ncbi:MAG: HNH endonuclease domain-containing protein [Opitutaceae bacterium]|nr:HNH endonuclease domain-containing protein [Opitutaceae bacterium]
MRICLEDIYRYSAGFIRRTPYAYIVFTPAALDLVRGNTSRAPLPPRARFTRLRFGRCFHPVLRLPEGEGFQYFRRLSLRLERHAYGDLKRKRRRELLQEQDYFHTRADLRALWEIQGGRCYYSGVPLGRSFATANYHVDHLTPLSRFGHDGPSNLALVAATVNAQKRDQTRWVFLKYFQTSARLRARMKRIDRERLRRFRGAGRKPGRGP